MLLIYTEKITNRVKFTMGLYFRDILHVKYELTSDQQAFEAYDGPKMSYGKSPVKDELFLAAEHILFERKIKHIDLNFIDFEGIPAFSRFIINYRPYPLIRLPQVLYCYQVRRIFALQKG